MLQWILFCSCCHDESYVGAGWEEAGAVRRRGMVWGGLKGIPHQNWAIPQQLAWHHREFFKQKAVRKRSES